MNIYLQSIRILAMAYAKETSKILLRCACAKRGFDWSKGFTIDLEASGKLAESMRDNLTKLQELNVSVEIPKGKTLLQGMIFGIKQITFGPHLGLERKIHKIFQDDETDLWMAEDDSMTIKKEILKHLRGNKYDPDEPFHNDCRVVDNEDEALEWLYSECNIYPDLIGAALWTKTDKSKPMYHVLDHI